MDGAGNISRTNYVGIPFDDLSTISISKGHLWNFEDDSSLATRERSYLRIRMNDENKQRTWEKGTTDSTLIHFLVNGCKY